MRSMGPINESGLHFGARLERSADFERFDDRAGKLRSHVVSKPEYAGYVEFNLLPSGKKFFQALAVVHHDACGRQPACRLLREISAVLMQQIARCRLQKGLAARVKPTFYQKVHLFELVRGHAQGKSCAFRSAESACSKRPYQARHLQESLLAFLSFALLFMVCH